jgi:hypothetical protein
MSAFRPSLKHRATHRRWRVGVLVASLLACSQAGAVFTFLPYANPRFIQLQVGSAGAAINNVTFNVTGANTSPSPLPVQGVPDVGTPATTPTGGVRVRMRGQWASGNQTLTLSVNSAAGLACVGATGCGSTVIPFNTISWVAHEKSNFTTFDIQSGSFNGSATQTLSAFSCCGTGSVEMANTLVFTYTNATLYPAGQYRGRVVFTASIQ